MKQFFDVVKHSYQCLSAAIRDERKLNMLRTRKKPQHGLNCPCSTLGRLASLRPQLQLIVNSDPTIPRQRLTFRAALLFASILFASASAHLLAQSTWYPPSGSCDSVFPSSVSQNQTITISGSIASNNEDTGGNPAVWIFLDDNSNEQIAWLEAPSPGWNWSFSYNVGALSLGQHTIDVDGVDCEGAIAYLGSQTFTVVPLPPPAGVLESVSPGTIYQNQSITSSGWAADPASGGPVSEVDLLINGNAVGQATLGQPTDGPYGGGTGFTINYNTSSLSPGQYTVTAQATDANGTTLLSGSQVITVLEPPPPAGTLEFVSAGNPTYQNQTIYGWGWAADPATGNPVSEVDLVIDGNVVCQASLGQSTDGPYGGSTGFTFSYKIGMLGTGQHNVWTQAIDPYGATRLSGTQSFTVKAVNQPATIVGLNAGFCTTEQNIDNPNSDPNDGPNINPNINPNPFEPSLFYPYESEDPADLNLNDPTTPPFIPHIQWWVNMVDEAAFAHVQYLAMGVDGDSDYVINNNKYNYRSAMKVGEAVKAIDIRGYQGVVNLALFDDTNGYNVSYSLQDHPGKQMDMGDQANWLKYWWQYKWEPFFTNVPDQYRQKVHGKPLVIIWTIVPQMTNVKGNLSPLIVYLRSKCQSEFGFDPFIVVDSSWVSYDSNILKNVDGVDNWFNNNNSGNAWSKDTVNARSGLFTTGVCVPGYYGTNSYGIVYQHIARNYGNTFANALSNVISSDLVLIENENDTGENTEVYRGSPDSPSPYGTPPAGERWICPNDYLDIIRDYNLTWAGAITFQAAACDAFCSPSSPPSGGLFRRAGNLNIAYTDASQTNWAVNLQAGEWVEYYGIGLVASSTYTAGITYSATSAATGSLLIDGTVVTQFTLPATGDLNTYQQIQTGTFAISQGKHDVQLRIGSGQARVISYSLTAF